MIATMAEWKKAGCNTVLGYFHQPPLADRSGARSFRRGARAGRAGHRARHAPSRLRQSAGRVSGARADPGATAEARFRRRGGRVATRAGDRAKPGCAHRAGGARGGSGGDHGSGAAAGAVAAATGDDLRVWGRSRLRRSPGGYGRGVHLSSDRPVKVAIVGGGCAVDRCRLRADARASTTGKYQVTVSTSSVGGSAAKAPRAAARAGASRSTACISGSASTRTPSV